MARASAPPWDPTPSCRIAVVRAAISPSLSQRAAARRISAETPHLNGPNFLGVNLLLAVHDAVLWDVGGDFLRFRQRSDPLIIIELFRGWVLSFIKNINCTLRRKQHSSGKSPVAHLLARMSSPRNERLLWPAPAKETMASKCFFSVIHGG